MARHLIATVGIAVGSPAALAQYAVHELLPPPGGTATIATSIDEQGRIVGSSQLAIGLVAVSWASFDAEPVVLGTLDGGLTSEAVSIASGLVVGTSDRDCGTPGSFLWTTSGGLVPIGPDTCNTVTPVSVNGSGDVLMQVGSPLLPLIWPLGPGSPRVLETWGQPATVLRIDAVGRVVGTSRHHPEAEGVWRAIEWPAAGEPRLLDRLEPGLTGVDAAYDRNASGLIVGFARAGSVTRATVWDAAGDPIDAGEALGPGMTSQLVRINAGGQAVGSSGLGAILWTQDDGARALSSMVDATGDGWMLTTAQDINDAGIILGNGTNPSGEARAFVLAHGGPACVADLDGDGALTIFDFLAFQNLFDGGDLRADLDGDGTLTIFDFLEFQNLFDAGC
ncbi:MAG: hypothetical protein NCW75_14585 [Phycisphaera sp.]|nr:MAG: hypothetical protein NCW75_14585 [Phycisphaera sp.]